ncbi:MAG: glutaminase, partial [Sarcina sp.]
MENLLENLIENNRRYVEYGKLAAYIPELEKANKNDLGIYVVTLDGKEYGAGEWNKNFTIQSISKVVSLMIAIMDNGRDKVFSRVGVEPTGDSFNSIVSLNKKPTIKPFNPMINAGAIVTTSLISGETDEEKFQKILSFTRRVTGNPHIDMNEEVYKSESQTGDRNRALAYFMKSNGVLVG